MDRNIKELLHGNRPKRAKLTREEIVKRMRELPQRKDKIVAAIRGKSKD